MLDNVVEINGLPLGKQRDEIARKRRHGMGFLGLGSTLTMMGMKYGEDDSLEFTEKVAREMAWPDGKKGWNCRGKRACTHHGRAFEVTGDMLRRRPEMQADGYVVGDMVTGKVLLAKYSRYMQQGCRIRTGRGQRAGRGRIAFYAPYLDCTHRNDFPVPGQ